MKTFQEFLTEDEYTPVLKAAHFKSRGTVGGGNKEHHHPVHGYVHIDKHGGWKHIPHNGEPSQGTTAISLKAHFADHLKD